MLVPDRRGFTYLLPFDTSLSDHEFFDPVTRTTVPLAYDGETEVEGKTVARFRAEVPETDLAREALGGRSAPTSSSPARRRGSGSTAPHGN